MFMSHKKGTWLIWILFLFREAEDDLVEKPPREAELFVFDNCSKGIGKIYMTLSH